MTDLCFTSTLDSAHREELERQLFFNQNQSKVRSDIFRLIQRYGMAHVACTQDRLRVVLEAAPEPQTLYVLEQSNGDERLVGVMVYLREADTLSLVIAAVDEGFVGTPLLWKMIEVLCDVARRIKGINSVTLFPGTSREGKVLIQGPTGRAARLTRLSRSGARDATFSEQAREAGVTRED